MYKKQLSLLRSSFVCGFCASLFLLSGYQSFSAQQATAPGSRSRPPHLIVTCVRSTTAVSWFRGLFAALAAAVLTACASLGGPACPDGHSAAVQDLLYFGVDKPGGQVNPEEWAQFLSDSVTPRFPAGLTTWQASGQWRSATGTVVQESSYVLSLAHPHSTEADASVQALVNTYKSRFQQEAVLRVRTQACMSL